MSSIKSLNGRKPFLGIDTPIRYTNIILFSIACLFILSGCAANLNYSVSEEGVERLRHDYTLTGCTNTNGFPLKKASPPPPLVEPNVLLKAEYFNSSIPDSLFIPEFDFKIEGGLLPENFDALGCLASKMFSQYGLPNHTAIRLLNNITFYSYEEGMAYFKARLGRPVEDIVIYRERTPDDGYWVYEQVTPYKKEKRWVPFPPDDDLLIVKRIYGYIPHIPSHQEKYFRTVILVNLDTLNFNKEFSRTGLFFNQIRSNDYTLYISDLVAAHGYDGVIGDVTVEEHYTLLTAVHDILPVGAGIGGFILFKSLYEQNNGENSTSILYGISAGILSYFATKIFLNIFLPDQSSTTIEMTMARIRD